MPRLPALSLLTRIGLLTSLLLALAMTILGNLIFAEVQQEMQRHTQDALDSNLRLLRQSLIEEGGSVVFSVRDGLLHIGEHAVTDNDAAVDRVRAIVGSAATIFLGDTRAATNILLPNGVRAVGTKLAPGAVYDAVLKRGEMFRGEAEILGTPYVTLYEPIRALDRTIIGILYVGIKRADYFALIDALMRHTIAVGVAVAIAAVFMLCLVLRRALAPLRGLHVSMQRLVDGDLDTEITSTGRTDEIGAMTSAVRVFKEGLIRNRALEAQTASLRADEQLHRRAALQTMADDLEKAVSGVVRTVKATSLELKQTAEALSVTAGSTARQSVDAANAAEQASSNVVHSVGVAEDLGTLVQEIRRHVTGSVELGQAASREASQTTALVQDLSTAATKIGDVVAIISAIASQTNLLALNATIEAARAGAMGRGFAVVAVEVKALAQQTAAATGEIRQHIERIQRSTGHAVDAIDGIHARIQEISGVATTIAQAVENQDDASREIVRHVKRAAAGTEAVTTNVAGVARAAEETGAAAGQVLVSASELSGQSDHLSAEVDRFLRTVRAA